MNSLSTEICIRPSMQSSFKKLIFFFHFFNEILFEMEFILDNSARTSFDQLLSYERKINNYYETRTFPRFN